MTDPQENHDAFWAELCGRVAEAEETLAEAEQKLAAVEVEERMAPAEVEKIVAAVTGGDVVDFAAAKERVEKRGSGGWRFLQGSRTGAAAAVVVVIASIAFWQFVSEDRWVPADKTSTFALDDEKAWKDLRTADDPDRRLSAFGYFFTQVRVGITTLRTLRDEKGPLAPAAEQGLQGVRDALGAEAFPSDLARPAAIKVIANELTLDETPPARKSELLTEMVSATQTCVYALKAAYAAENTHNMRIALRMLTDLAQK